MTLYERVLAISVRSLGAEHPIVAKVHNNLGDELLAIGEVDQAISHDEQALAIWERSVGVHHPDIAVGLHNLGSCYLAKGDATAALGAFRRGVAVRAEAFGPSHFLVAGDYLDIAEALRLKGEAAEAVSYATKAVDLDAKIPPGEREYEPRTKLLLGMAQLALGMPARAVETLGAALSPPPAGDTDSITLARARFALAQALVSSRGDRDRANGLAAQAHDALRAAGPRAAEDALAVERWLPGR